MQRVLLGWRNRIAAWRQELKEILGRFGISQCSPPNSHSAPIHIRKGRIGEEAARKTLEQAGLKHLASNFRSRRGEIDLIFRDNDCLVFVEVKTRSDELWSSPAAAVNFKKQRRLSRAAFDYLHQLGSPQVKLRFDIVEVLLEDEMPCEIRHRINAFPLSSPYRYG